MAKKREIPKVKCTDCKPSTGVVDNHLTDCSNPSANPGNYKVGAWERRCEYFEIKR